MKKVFFFCVLLLCCSSGCTFRMTLTEEELSVGIGIDAVEIEPCESEHQ